MVKAKSYKFLGSFIGCLTLCSTLIAAESNQSLAKKRVLADLNCIESIFDVKYAPRFWKQEFAGWDLTQSIEEAKNKVIKLPSVSTKESQVILRDFFNSVKDYHVNVRFFSTENANLPFLIKGAKGRYFICHIDRQQLTKKEFPFEIGDELLTFGGRPIRSVIEELRLKELGTNTPETDLALAEGVLTNRRGDHGHTVPSGPIEITGIQRGARGITKVKLNWRYFPEKVKDFSKLGLACTANYADEEIIADDIPSLLKKTRFFDKLMICGLWDKSYVGAFSEMNKHSLGSRLSFLPPLGQKIWKSSSDSLLDAYIFETPNGRKIGYIRIPHYLGDVEEVTEFGMTVSYFQTRTDALVIDQLNNPGGSLYYGYGLLTTLTDKPLATPKQRYALTQDEIHLATTILPYLNQVTSDELARLVMGETWNGYPVDYDFVKLMKQFCEFLIKEWNEGKLLSGPIHTFGFNDIKPHPKYRYNKPILMLINTLDFSCGDFIPAVLQDNKRATLFGTRTAGAGGYLQPVEYPNHSGIKSYSLTGSIAERSNKEPLENLGVKPDIQYEFSVVDLQENYKEYVAEVTRAIESIVSKQ